MALIVEGKVLGVEHVQGQGDNGAYSYVRVHVLSGMDVLKARLGKEYGPAPSEGATIRAEVYVSGYKDRSGSVRQSFSLVKPLPAVIGSTPATTTGASASASRSA